jgi:hypothetical protein
MKLARFITKFITRVLEVTWSVIYAQGHGTFNRIRRFHEEASFELHSRTSESKVIQTYQRLLQGDTAPHSTCLRRKHSTLTDRLPRTAFATWPLESKCSSHSDLLTLLTPLLTFHPFSVKTPDAWVFGENC